MITKEQQLRIDILFKQISNLESSDSSTMTELSVCRDLIKQKYDTSLSYFDMSCGKGTILLCLYLEHWNNLDISDIEEKNQYIIDKITGNDISKAQVDIAKSTLKKVQKILKIQNILEPFVYNYNILDCDKKEINDLKKKFDVVITNPPYNSERGDNNQSVDIYPDFVDKAFELAKRYVIMITKSNWMNKPSMKNFREKMINGYNVDKIMHYHNAPFKGADIKGGVSYFVIDNENTKETFELNNIVYDRKVALDFLPYSLNERELKILDKLLKYDKFQLSNYRPKGFYEIKSNDNRFKNESTESSILCYVAENKGGTKYIEHDELSSKAVNDINKYKIFTSSSSGNTENPYYLGKIKKVGMNSICSESLVSWVFDNENDMEDWYKYINSKIVRFSISCIKTKHDVSKNSFSLIPNIDFSKLEKIDDESIYKYLNLTEEDIETIEERCEKLKLIK